MVSSQAQKWFSGSVSRAGGGGVVLLSDSKEDAVALSGHFFSGCRPSQDVCQGEALFGASCASWWDSGAELLAGPRHTGCADAGARELQLQAQQLCWL